MNTNIVFLIIALVVIVIGLPVCAGIFYALRARQLEHLERIRAIELGQPLPGEEVPGITPPQSALMIGMGVPVGVFGVVWLASQTGVAGSEAWQAAGFVGVAAVVCGTVLSLRAHASPDRRCFTNAAHSKPVQDPDTFDVAGQRG